MGTPNNLEQLRDAGLGNEINASPNDLVIAVMGEEDICNEALVLAQQRLTSKPDDETDSGIKSPEKVSLEMASAPKPGDMAFIRVASYYPVTMFSQVRTLPRGSAEAQYCELDVVPGDLNRFLSGR